MNRGPIAWTMLTTALVLTGPTSLVPAVSGQSALGRHSGVERSFNVDATTYYVAPDGNDAAPGSLERPFRTIEKAVATVRPGALIYVRGGTYHCDKTIVLRTSGAPDRPIRLWAYGDEEPVFLVKQGKGFIVRGAYWRLNGLAICRAEAAGLQLEGDSAHHNVIERFQVHRNGNTGINLTRGAAYNLIVNCDSYRNFDPPTHGEHADGFGAKFEIGRGNVFIGCRAWNNADDGFDCWYAGNALRIERSYAFTFTKGNIEKNVLRNNLSLGAGIRIDPNVNDRHNSWSRALGVRITDRDFLGLDDSVVLGPRRPDGSIPRSDFLLLASASGAIDQGADVNAKNWLGYAPFHWACYFGHADLAALLLTGAPTPASSAKPAARRWRSQRRWTIRQWSCSFASTGQTNRPCSPPGLLDAALDWATRGPGPQTGPRAVRGGQTASFEGMSSRMRAFFGGFGKILLVIGENSAYYQGFLPCWDENHTARLQRSTMQQGPMTSVFGRDC